MRVSIREFEGIRPIRAVHRLAYNEAQISENTKIYGGELRPFYHEALEHTLIGDGLIRTIYHYLSQHWLEWSATVDVALGPVPNDTEFRYYYTGDGIPKKSNETETTNGVGPLPQNFFPIAVCTPKYAPSLANGGGGSGDNRETAYAWTNVTTWGEESLPSPESNLLTSQNGDSITVSGMTNVWQAGTAYTLEDTIVPSTPNGYMYKCVQAGTSGGVEPTWGTTLDGNTNDNTVIWRAYVNNLSTKRIYRIIASEQTAVYLFVAEIAATLTSYVDSLLDAQLGEQLPTGYGTIPLWNPPPDGLTNIVTMPNGILAASFGKDIYFSEPYQPHAWPFDYVISLESTVVALGVMENNLVAATEGHPYIITGTTPATMTPVKMPDNLPCRSKRGLYAFWRGVLYPSNDGLVLVSEGRADVISKQHYTKEEWQTLAPDTMTGVYQDGRYFGFYDLGIFEGNAVVFDLERQDLFTIDLGDDPITLYAPALFVDKATDTLYIVESVADVLLYEDGTPHPARDGVVLFEDGGRLVLENSII